MTAMLRERIRQCRLHLVHLPRTLRLVWKASKRWTLVWAAILALQGILPALVVELTRLAVDELVAVMRDGGISARFVVYVISLGGILLLSELLGAVSHWVKAAHTELVQDHVQALVHAKSAAVDLEFYDTPEFYDHMHRAREEAPYRPIALAENFGSLAQSAITLLAMSVVLTRFGLWVPVVLLTGTAPACIVMLLHTDREHRWRRSATADERRAWYHDWLLTCREAAAELRLFGLAPKLQHSYQSVRRKLRAARRDLEKSHSVSAGCAAGIGLAVTAGAMFWITWRAVSGRATLGEVALFYQAFTQGLAQMRSLLEQVGRVYGNALYLGDLFEFLDLKTRIVSPPAQRRLVRRSAASIVFRGVSFRYPGAARDALRDFDLVVPPGQIAAIVGPNGAGKSTIVRLLCRFYDPQSGGIFLNGVNLRDIPAESLRGRISAQFQNPVYYSATVEENIAPGARVDRHRMTDAAAAAGVGDVVSRLPLGYKQILGRWYAGGAELSGGEWRRIALARAYYRDATLILLDEPTSEMDPWTEADWMQRFRAVSRGRTGIVITHRLGTAKLADVIHVMERGRVLESGNHQQLLDAGGLYATAWGLVAVGVGAPVGKGY